MTNLLQYGSAIVSETESIDDQHTARNIIENLESRSGSVNIDSDLV